MKKMGTLMAELGFNKEAPDSVKEAFIKHLIKASAGVNVATPSETLEVKKNPEKVKPLLKTSTPPLQLSFQFDETLAVSTSGKKAVS